MDSLLAAALAPVTAPDELWERIQAARAPEPRRAAWRIAWPATAAAMALLAVATFWQFRTVRDPAAELRRVAMAEAANRHLDLQGGTCAELHDWLKLKARLDVPLPAASPAVELLGARVIEHRGSSIAAIAYRFAGGAATLFVGRRNPRDGAAHTTMRVASVGGGELYSWSMRDQVYALLSSSNHDPRDGCRLCHAR